MNKIIFISMICFLSMTHLFGREYVTIGDFESMKATYGDKAVQRLKSWNTVMKNSENKAEQIKIKNINAYFNQYRYNQNKYNWKKIKKGTPLIAFIGKGIGDSEDYALAKYYSLRKLGVPSYKLRLVSGKFYGEGHLLLAYYKNLKDTYVLDNKSNPLRKLSKTYPFMAETYFNEDEHGVINPNVEEKRVGFEYEYFSRLIAKNTVSMTW